MNSSESQEAINVDIALEEIRNIALLDTFFTITSANCSGVEKGLRGTIVSLPFLVGRIGVGRNAGDDQEGGDD
jgi:hypothetical protein